MPNIRNILTMTGLKKKATNRVGMGTTEALTSYNVPNKKMARALRDLGHREARAFRKGAAQQPYSQHTGMNMNRVYKVKGCRAGRFKERT